MAQFKAKKVQVLESKKGHSIKSATLACRRCGAECQCSEDELDAGGPA